jgi:8-oxo-dGTP pyrophosphatase MutT (NUDIX family)
MYTCDADFREQLHARLRQFDRQAASMAETVGAAVALPVVECGYGANLEGLPQLDTWSQDAALLLTRRSSRLRDHPRQWALPGGRIDPGESGVEAALRELHEEVGIDIDESQVLGQLDDFVTRSGFTITPVVVWVGDARDVTPNPDEVDSVHRIPVAEFLRDDAPMLDHDEGEHWPVLRMPVGTTWIAAPTAALLYQFRELCLLEHATRVAHFEQPRFAWK